MALYALDSQLPQDLMKDLMLCVTELVTNCVQHPPVGAGGRVEMTVTLSPASVRIEVGDSGPGFQPGEVERGRDEGGGWGLYIVDRLADRWGVDRRDLNWVWFEIDVDGPGARA